MGWPGFAAPIQVPISDALGRAARPRSPLQTVMDLIHFNGGLQCSLPFGGVTVANWRRLPTYLPGQSGGGEVRVGGDPGCRRVRVDIQLLLFFIFFLSEFSLNF